MATNYWGLDASGQPARYPPAMQKAVDLKRAERIVIIKAERKRRREMKQRRKTALFVLVRRLPGNSFGLPARIVMFFKEPAISPEANAKAAGLDAKYRHLANQMGAAARARQHQPHP